MQVDYVIPFVDSSDREWVGTYRKYDNYIPIRSRLRSASSPTTHRMSPAWKGRWACGT